MADAPAPKTSTDGPPPEPKPDADWLLDDQAPAPAAAEQERTDTNEWLAVPGSDDDADTPDPPRPPDDASPAEAHAEPTPGTPRGRFRAWRQRRRARRADAAVEPEKPAGAPVAPEPGPTAGASSADDWAAAADAQGDARPMTRNDEEAPVADEWTAAGDDGEAPSAEADPQPAESEATAQNEPAAESEATAESEPAAETVPTAESEAAEGELRHSIDELRGRVAVALEGLERVEEAVRQTRRGRATDRKRVDRLEDNLEQSRGADPERLEELRGEVEELRGEVEGIRRERAADAELLDVVTQRFRTMLPPPANPGDGPLDLNTATFEQLRGLGISTSQAGRVIAAREATGGYGSLDELDGLFGFSAEQLAEFKRRVRI